MNTIKKIIKRKKMKLHTYLFYCSLFFIPSIQAMIKSTQLLARIKASANVRHNSSFSPYALRINASNPSSVPIIPVTTSASNTHVMPLGRIICPPQCLSHHTRKKSSPTLWKAVMSNDIETLLALYRHHSPEFTDSTPDHANALHLAAGCTLSSSIMEILIAGGTPINEQTISKGYTPFHVAALSNNPEAIRVLMKYRALPLRDHTNKKPLDLAPKGLRLQFKDLLHS